MESILWEAPMIAYRPVESQQPSPLQDKHSFCESDLLFDRHRCSGWILFDGILTLVLGYLIWRNWPSGSTWTIGTLVGIKLLESGFTRLIYATTARKALAVLS